MNKERLLRLADLLEADANNPNGVKFSLANWAIDAAAPVDSNDYETIDTFRYDKKLRRVPVDCNTAACAVGLAAISGIFAADGFGWQIIPQFDGKGWLVPTFKDSDGWGAVNKFFEIPHETAVKLFQSESYAVTKGAEGERAVAQRIRETVVNTI